MLVWAWLKKVDGNQHIRLEALRRVHAKSKLGKRIPEEYLEAIYELASKGEKVRPIDIARTLNVAPSTVKKVLSRLVREGYISYEPYLMLKLTEKGEKAILNLKKRHDIISRLFVRLGMDRIKAETEAERIEHNLSEESTMILEALAEILEEDEELAFKLRHYIQRKHNRATEGI